MKIQSTKLKIAAAIIFAACLFTSINVMAIGDDEPCLQQSNAISSELAA